jgi:hypothetical protein
LAVERNGVPEPIPLGKPHCGSFPAKKPLRERTAPILPLEALAIGSK